MIWSEHHRHRVLARYFSDFRNVDQAGHGEMRWFTALVGRVT